MKSRSASATELRWGDSSHARHRTQSSGLLDFAGYANGAVGPRNAVLREEEGAACMFSWAKRSALGETVAIHRLGRVRWQRRRCKIAPAIEALEGRRLLSAYTGPSAVRNILSSGGVFRIEVEQGPGVFKVHPAGKGAIDLTAYGTNADTTLSISQVRPRYHFPSQLLSIHTLTVTSGELGGLDASAAKLTGIMTPLMNTMQSLTLGELGPGARVEVDGSVGVMAVSTINLGPTGLVSISGGLNTAEPTGSTSTASLIGVMTIGSLNLDGGRFLIGQDSLAPISILDNMTISHDGLFSVGRDLDDSLTVNGNLELDSGGQLMVGRNLSELTVNGNVIVNPSGSGIVVNGVLGDMVVEGLFQGQGGTAAPTFFDLGVGLTINGLSILGGNTAQDSLINANIRAGGSISGVDIAYGTVNSTIQPNTPPPG
jgi:hypothetical protein